MILPSVSGYWNMIPLISFLLKSISNTFPTSMLIPNGSALVWTQAIVWGCSLSDRMNLFLLFFLWKRKNIVLKFQQTIHNNNNAIKIFFACYTYSILQELLLQMFPHLTMMHLHWTIQWDLIPWFDNWSSSQDDPVQSLVGMVCTALSYWKYNWRRHSIRKKIFNNLLWLTYFLISIDTYHPGFSSKFRRMVCGILVL